MLRFIAACAAFLLIAMPAAADVTRWRVRSSEGLDALLLLGAASGDVMQAEIYPDEIAWARAHMSPEALAALQEIDQALRVGKGLLTGPTLVNIFSVAPSDTLADVIASAEDPDRFLRPALQAEPDWNEQDYAAGRPIFAAVAAALRGLDAAGFGAWREQTQGAQIRAGLSAVEAAVRAHDVIAENQRFFARRLDPEIEIVVLAFNKPYGIRIRGQRFISHYSWEAGVQLRTAAHEIFHPPYDENDWRITSRVAALAADPWMSAIVTTHDARFGYNSFEGILNEDSTQALDQIVAERMGFARNARERWRAADGGMHMLAAALYQAMKEDGFDRRGGPYQDWLISALDRGLLTPAEVRRRAALIVGRDAVDRWAPR
ncbi:hypothetical protein [Terricaulis sp.]|uniref:hypothetical protein n=1 Tax=Terricaulis sp. TaxID=2768686 RepID=UPI003782DE5F